MPSPSIIAEFFLPSNSDLALIYFVFTTILLGGSAFMGWIISRFFRNREKRKKAFWQISLFTLISFLTAISLFIG